MRQISTSTYSMTDSDGLGSEVQYDRTDFQVILRDGYPTLRLPNGQQIRLRVHVSEWSYESPNMGAGVDMKPEVEHVDDGACWHLSPDRETETGVSRPESFPLVTIEPEFHGGDDD